MIPEDVVERAAKAAFWQDDLGGHVKGRWTWDTIPPVGRENYREMVRATLTASGLPARVAELEAALGEMHKLIIEEMGAATNRDLACDGPVGDEESKVWARIEALTLAQRAALNAKGAPDG